MTLDQIRSKLYRIKMKELDGLFSKRYNSVEEFLEYRKENFEKEDLYTIFEKLGFKKYYTKVLEPYELRRGVPVITEIPDYRLKQEAIILLYLIQKRNLKILRYEYLRNKRNQELTWKKFKRRNADKFGLEKINWTDLTFKSHCGEDSKEYKISCSELLRVISITCENCKGSYSITIKNNEKQEFTYYIVEQKSRGFLVGVVNDSEDNSSDDMELEYEVCSTHTDILAGVIMCDAAARLIVKEETMDKNWLIQDSISTLRSFGILNNKPNSWTLL